jgi:hypothetical protein
MVLSQGHAVESFSSSLLDQAGIHFGSLESILSWDERAFYPVLRDTGSHPVTLLQKYQDLTRLLQVYRASKKRR